MGTMTERGSVSHLTDRKKDDKDDKDRDDKNKDDTDSPRKESGRPAAALVAADGMAVCSPRARFDDTVYLRAGLVVDEHHPGNATVAAPTVLSPGTAGDGGRPGPCRVRGRASS